MQPSSRGETVVARARDHFERTLVRVRGELEGSVAALGHPRRSGDLNDGEVFLRDSVPVGNGVLLADDGQRSIGRITSRWTPASGGRSSAGWTCATAAIGASAPARRCRAASSCCSI